MKLIYIAGYGRSGSTILDIILNNSGKIGGFGEITQFLSDYKDYKCSCGATFMNCEFWKDFIPVLNKYEPYKRDFRKHESLRSVFKASGVKYFSQYYNFNNELIEFIYSKTNHEYIDDS